MLHLSRHRGEGSPPPSFWSACHPSTVGRFKATVTCPAGHISTLRSHSVASDGTVSPSLVCLHAGCGFHEFVRLSEWDAGAVP